METFVTKQQELSEKIIEEDDDEKFSHMSNYAQKLLSYRDVQDCISKENKSGESPLDLLHLVESDAVKKAIEAEIMDKMAHPCTSLEDPDCQETFATVEERDNHIEQVCQFSFVIKLHFLTYPSSQVHTVGNSEELDPNNRELELELLMVDLLSLLPDGLKID